MADDVLLISDWMALGFESADEFAVDSYDLGNGTVKTNLRRDRVQRVLTFSYDHHDASTRETIRAWFRGRRGSTRSGLMRDWSAYELDGEEIGEGDGSETQFQIKKTWDDSVNSYEETIKYVRDGTLVVYLDGSEVSSNDYTEANGLITFDTPPGNTVKVTVDCEYDIPVRLSEPRITFEVTGPNGVGRTATIVAVEELE